MRRDLLILLAWFAGFFALVAFLLGRPDSDLVRGALPESELATARTPPSLEELVAPHAAASEDVPAWRADRAIPSSAEGPLTLAGLWHGLDLVGVRVELGEGVELVAAEGRLVEAGRLELGPLHGERDGQRVLVASGGRLSGGAVELRGPVVLHPDGGARELVQRGLTTSRTELLALLRR